MLSSNEQRYEQRYDPQNFTRIEKKLDDIYEKMEKFIEIQTADHEILSLAKTNINMLIKDINGNGKTGLKTLVDRNTRTSISNSKIIWYGGTTVIGMIIVLLIKVFVM